MYVCVCDSVLTECVFSVFVCPWRVCVSSASVLAYQRMAVKGRVCPCVSVCVPRCVGLSS